jgi:hypothetical protein
MFDSGKNKPDNHNGQRMENPEKCYISTLKEFYARKKTATK